jgi:hypothetical protein
VTNHDREHFGRMMFALGDTFNEPVSEVRVEAYFDALRDLDAALVLAAGRRAIAECRYFPRPIELRELVHGNGDEAAELAWNALRGLVRRYGYLGTDGRGSAPEFPDDATRRAALELYGGWVALCSSLPCEGPEFLGARKAFIANYKAYRGLEQRARLALPGPASKAITDGSK